MPRGGQEKRRCSYSSCGILNLIKKPFATEIYAPDRIMNIATMTPIQTGLETEHDLLEFDFVARPRRVKKPARSAYNFKSADFENLKLQIMQRSAISNSVSCNSGVDACWSIPKARVRDSNTPPWIDKEVRHLLKRKESGRAAKKDNSAFYLEKFRILRKESKALINRKLKEYHTSLGDSLKVNTKRFGSYFRHKTKSNSIPANAVRTEGDRSLLEWRWQKPSTSISILRL